MRDEESRLDRTSVRIISSLLEDFIVGVDIVVVDSVIEGDGDHLRNCSWLQLVRDLSSVTRAEAIRKNAHRRIARPSTVGVLIGSADVFVGAIGTIRDTVAELLLLDTVGVSARELPTLTDRLISRQQRKSQPGFFQLLAVLHVRFPVASLLLDIESKTRRTTQGQQALHGTPDYVSAVLICCESEVF